MSDLSTLLDAADDREDPVIREVARRSGLLWKCRCGDDNPSAARTCNGCGAHIEDVCAPGDPDPTPKDGPECGVVASEDQGRVVCTRRAGHTGQQHVAGDGLEVVAVWEPDEALHVAG